MVEILILKYHVNAFFSGSQVFFFHLQHRQIRFEYERKTLYREIFTPVFITTLFPSLSSGEFKTWRIPMSQIICLNSTVYWRIQHRAKLFASFDGRNYADGK